jgi:hypothetical protein
MKPTVGRIVHFYDHTLPPGGHNGVGPGPYAAIVTQTFVDSGYINLMVMPPEMPPFSRGSVLESPTPYRGTYDRYWVWPPRE